ncbi:hypothetical protein GKZ75_09590 [Kocuria indica]|uniref:Uncharacterized protein n=1 Tax=Kocuria marina subsp. indica TaxID=1049583 RepID=A0A6N9QZ46_9MICC|nr:hypothetical protein [Kocuria indica]NDO78469.1 hypothetical protein [Kocuria indica]
MAMQYINDLLTDTITREMIETEFRGSVTEDGGKLYALGRKDEAAIRAWAERIAPQPTETPVPAQPQALATEPQVRYIMSLLNRGAHEEGGFMNGPTTEDGVRKLSKAAASSYITSLKGEY